MHWDQISGTLYQINTSAEENLPNLLIGYLTSSNQVACCDTYDFNISRSQQKLCRYGIFIVRYCYYGIWDSNDTDCYVSAHAHSLERTIHDHFGDVKRSQVSSRTKYAIQEESDPCLCFRHFVMFAICDVVIERTESMCETHQTFRVSIHQRQRESIRCTTTTSLDFWAKEIWRKDGFCNCLESVPAAFQELPAIPFIVHIARTQNKRNT